MLEIKKQILKRYKTDHQETDLDTKSPKQIAKMLFKRKKKIGITHDNSLQLPMV